MNHLGTQTLETPRLILRKITLQDSESLYKYASNKNVTKYMTWSAHKDINETKGLVTKWTQQYEENTFYHWAIALKETNEVIGLIGIAILTDNTLRAELGYWIGEEFWGQGIMTEALNKIIQFLFEKVNLNVICANHVPENPASGKVMQKANMLYEGTIKKSCLLSNGTITDRVTYSITKEDYFNNNHYVSDNCIIKALKDRRSIRKFKSKMIPKEIIEKIIEAGLYAASGHGEQSSIIIAVTNKEKRDKLSKLNSKIGGWGETFDPFYGAPVVLIVLDKKDAHTKLYDGSLVIGNLMQASDSFGLGSCWIHRAKEEFETKEGKEFFKSLGINDEYEGVGHCIIGYIDGEKPKASPRKNDRVFFVE